MEIKNKVYQFAKMIKDIIPDKIPEGVYYNARNIRFISADKEINSGFHFEIGNVLSLQLPSPQLNYTLSSITYIVNKFDSEGNLLGSNQKELKYKNNIISTFPYGKPRNQIEETYYTDAPTIYRVSRTQRIIGFVETRKGVVLFSTDNNGFDCIWYLKDIDDTLDIELLYMRNMGFSIENPIEALNNYENDNVDKVYWIDTKHQLRHVNLEHSIENKDSENLIDLDVSLINAIATSNLKQPEFIEIQYGGTHTAGMIQYAYTLYKMNGSQTSLSPLSNLIPLGKSTNQGGDLNEVVGSSPSIRITDLDSKFDNIIVYAIKYTSLNQEPQVSIIEDRPIPDEGEIIVYDNGSIIRQSTLDELMFINSSLNFPGSFNSKDNTLFIADFKERIFEVKLDVRAYQFPKNPNHSARVYNNIKLDTNNELTGEIRDIHSVNTGGLTAYTDDPDDTFDSINLGYDYYKYQGNRTTLGGEGKYVKFELSNINRNENGRGRFFKDNEIYRLGIKFFNTYGQETEPMWVCDFKAPQGNLEGRFNTLKFQLKPEFNTWLNNQQFDDYTKPVGYKVLIAERTHNDKTIISSGLVSTMILSGNSSVIGNVDPSFLNQDGTFPRVDPEFDIKTRSIAKMPSPLLRNAWMDTNPSKIELNSALFQFNDSPMQRARHHSALGWSSWFINDSYKFHRNVHSFIYESPYSGEPSLIKYESYQDTKIMQLYSPEAIFDTLPSPTENSTLEVRYGMLNNKNGTWMRVVNAHTNNIWIEFAVENILNPMIPHGNNYYPVEWLIGGGDNSGFSAMQEFGGNSQRGRHLPAPFNTWVSKGWNSKGMFSNWYTDKLGEDQGEHPTVLQLFYRKYGDDLEHLNNLNNQIYQGGMGSYLPVLISKETISVINGPNGTSLTHDISNLIDVNSIIDTINVTTYIKSGSPSGEIISLTVGDNTIEQELNDINTLTLSNSLLANNNDLNTSFSLNISNSTGNVEIEIHLNTISNYRDLSNSIINSVTLNGISNFNPNTSGTITILQSSLLKPGSKNSNFKTSHLIYGRPVISKLGEGVINYNGNGYFRFSNNLNGYKNDELGGTDNNADKAIRKMNVNGINCLTFVLNPEAHNDNKLATAYETVVDQAQFLAPDKYRNNGSIYCDVVKSRNDIYLGNIYGGNSFEDRKRTNYLEVGDYYIINNNINTILNPGDTFVQDFKFLRMVRGSQTALDTTVIEHEEIVEYLTETTIDLMNRNDDSILEWDSKFSFSKEEYMNYNKVYSQKNIIGATRALDYTFKKIDNFGSTIRASKVKTPGELTDSWLQSLVNETIDLDGKYGKITKLANFNDNIYALQEKAISAVSINPRVQITDNDGGQIQLGTGQVLDDYTYLTTTSGSLKWSNITTPYGIFYIDSRNKTFNIINDKYEELSRTKGWVKWFKDNINHDEIKADNIYKRSGVKLGYDKLRTEVYLTYKTENKNWTLGYNLSQGSFSSFYDYNSDDFISINDKMLSINPNSYDKVYTMYKGKPTTFYGEQKGAEISFIANPEHLTECTFHNLEYVDRSYNDEKVETLYTFSSIKVENEFQDSGEVKLTPRINLRKLNRKWRLALPRNNNKVSRIRNNWVKITLKNDNVETQNHDINDFILYYTPNYKKLQ